MSYTEYLSRKKAAAPVVIDARRQNMDASTFTRHTRLATSSVFTPTEGVINNIQDMAFSTPKRPQSTQKSSGGRVPDASMWTDYSGGRAVGMDYKNGMPNQKTILNVGEGVSIPNMRVVSNCRTVAEPSPQATGVLQAGQVQKSAGDWVRLNKDCVESGRVAEPHDAATVGPSKFVDTHISVSGVFGIGTGNTGSSATMSNGLNGVPGRGAGGVVPVHTQSAQLVNRRWGPPRPSKGRGGIPVFTVASEDHPYKAGAAIAGHKYVEKHHGNPIPTAPRRVPTKFQIPAGAPAQLKINDPKPLV